MQQEKEGRDAHITGVPVGSLGSDEDWRVCNWCILVLHLFILNLVLVLRHKNSRERQTSSNLITIIMVYLHVCVFGAYAWKSEGNSGVGSPSHFLWVLDTELRLSGLYCKHFPGRTMAQAPVCVLILPNLHPSHRSKGKAQSISFLEYNFCVWVMPSPLCSDKILIRNSR